jgi:hypothetical protein
MGLSSSWEAASRSATQELSNIFGTRRFIAVFTRVLQCFLSWARSIQSIPPHPIPLRSILVLSSYLRLDLPRGLLPSGFPTKNPIWIPLLPILATCPGHIILLDLIILIILCDEYKLWRSSLCSSPTSYHFILFGSYILLSTLFSNTSLHSMNQITSDSARKFRGVQ